MTTSFCIKTNNNLILDYLLNQFNMIDLDNVFISEHKFKLYKNIIIHYTGENKKIFISNIADALSNTVIEFYEDSILKKLIYSNYFYFTDIEKQQIFENCKSTLSLDYCDIVFRKNIIYCASLAFLKDNNTFILDGFINFRIKKYIQILDETIDLAVDKLLIDREYKEFINLLKLYVNSKENTCPYVHLIYSKGESILLDECKNLIDIKDNTFSAKYLSDISFSSNDYSLNTLLNLIPSKLYIHLIDCFEDEFITTLKLIFEDRVYICNDCPICNIYKMSDQKLHRLTIKD